MAESPHWESAGMRSAISATSLNDPFLQLEAYANLDLPKNHPWHWQSKSGWLLHTRLDFSAGWLSGQGEDAFVGTAGPTFAFGKAGFPLFFDFGTSPTFISRYRFGPTDLGVNFQFTTHIGFKLELGSHFSVGYRVQHMSNASISRHNPGLDLHSFGLGYRF